MDFILPKVKMFKNYVYKNYWSDDRQDQILEMIFKGIEKAVFIDIGAGNGMDGNNTLLFKDHYNWYGTCIESDPILFNELKLYRPSDVLINSNDFNINDLLSKYNFRVQLLTLNHPNQLKILNSISKYDIDVIEIKITTKEENNAIVFLLSGKGYKLVGKTVKSLIMGHANSFFIKNLDNK